MSGIRRGRVVAHRWSVICAVWALAARSVAAQSFELDRFRPAPLAGDGFAVSGTDLPGHLHLDLALHADYARNPLILVLATGQKYAAVSDQVTTHWAAALGLGERSMLFVGVPVILLMQGHEPPTGIVTRLPSADGFGLGDAYLGGRVRLLGGGASRIGLALQAALSLPTASVQHGQHYSGDGAVAGDMRVLFDVRLGHTTLRANLGLHIRQDEMLLNTVVGDELTYGIGAQYTLLGDRLRLVADLYGGCGLKNLGERTASPLEALLGAKFVHAQGFYAALGVGPGLSAGIGSPDVRVLISVGFANAQRQ
jgi:OOP family OmpA-OmpF porin